MSNQPIRGTVLITGASGFIGRRLRNALLEGGADVVAIRRGGSPEPKQGRSVALDYADMRALRRVMEEEKPAYIFHVAGATKGVTYEDFRQANVMPTKNLLDAVKETGIELARFVHVSSLSSFGPSKKDRHHTEDAPRRPVEFYGKSKLEAEECVEATGDAIPWTILRPGGVYGPGDVDYFELFKSAAKGLNVFFGNRERWFSAIYVDDLIRATQLAATGENTKNKGYFVCDGKPLTWGDFQHHVVEASGRKARTLDLPEGLVSLAAIGGELLTKLDKKPRLFNRQKATMGAQEAWTCDSRAIRKDAGFQPEVSVAEGVRRAFAWYRSEGWI